MNTQTGEIRSFEEIEAMEEEKKILYVPVKRDLTVREIRMKEIAKYSPCCCGSGKKFKFCCYINPNAYAR